MRSCGVLIFFADDFGREATTTVDATQQFLIERISVSSHLGFCPARNERHNGGPCFVLGGQVASFLEVLRSPECITELHDRILGLNYFADED